MYNGQFSQGFIFGGWYRVVSDMSFEVMEHHKVKLLHTSMMITNGYHQWHPKAFIEHAMRQATTSMGYLPSNRCSYYMNRLNKYDISGLPDKLDAHDASDFWFGYYTAKEKYEDKCEDK